MNKQQVKLEDKYNELEKRYKELSKKYDELYCRFYRVAVSKSNKNTINLNDKNTIIIQ